jgi:signal transduction histidine kinase
MRRGLTWQLGVAFALVAVATAVIAGIMLSVVWQREFERYVRNGLQDYAEGYALSARNIYTSYGGWPSRMQLSMTTALAADIRVQVYDASGNQLLDSAEAGRPPILAGHTPPPPADAIGVVVPIMTVDGLKVGEVKCWAISQDGGVLTERDVSFRSASINALLLAAFIAVLLASAAGVLFSLGIVRPINHVTATAAALRAGRRDARTGMQGEDPVGVLGHTLDEMADSIQADREFERRLTADVAHELRTPLMAIQATVEAMQDGVLPADEQRLQTVRDETVRLSRLADSILELARLERGGVQMAREPLDPADPLSVALATHRALIESAGLSLDESVEQGMTVQGDTDRLTQAFGNLLSNAARYTPSGGRVEGTGASVRFDTTNLAPGNYTIRVRVTDDANQSAECTTQVTVEAPPPPPPPPQASKLEECGFRLNSSRDSGPSGRGRSFRPCRIAPE